MRTAVLMLFIGASLLPAAAAGTYDVTLADWAAVLETHVDAEGRTDFVALSGDRAALDRFVAALAADGPRSRPAAFATPAAVLAYHINAYNALAMHGVIERGIPTGFNSFFKRAGFFRFRGITVDGEETNLYDYENDVIRPLGDERVHFALNCMVRDCPRLPRVPFSAALLDEQLDTAAREFFAAPKHLQRHPDRREVRVSAILDFYTEDFVADGNRDSLRGYINRWLDEPIPAGWEVRFLDYDWRINQAPR